MSYKSLLVHVEPSETGQERVRQAVRLAQAFGARLIGVGARSFEPMPDPIGLSIMKLKEAIAEELAEAERLFAAEACVLGEAVQWRAVEARPALALLRSACGADLIISGDGAAAGPQEKVAAGADLIIAAGAPVLMAPPGTALDTRCIVIGWKDTREARRAVWDALPFLKRADRVLLLRFAAEGEQHPAGLAEATERLRLHGVRVEAQACSRTKSSVAADIVDAAQEASAGLIVVGGYGYPRLQEWALGGVTQRLLEQHLMSVLFSH